MSPKAPGKAMSPLVSKGRKEDLRGERGWQMASGRAVQTADRCGNMGVERSMVNLEKGVRKRDWEKGGGHEFGWARGRLSLCPLRKDSFKS